MDTEDQFGALRAYIGKETPGGCADCDAYQTVKEEFPGCFVVTVHHDDWCPSEHAPMNRAERRHQARRRWN